MKLIGLEEHFISQDIKNAWSRLPPDRTDDSVVHLDQGDVQARLEDLSEARLTHMDETGLDVQVLSLTTPGLHNVDADQAVSLARNANDVLAATVKMRPDRFEGFATLPIRAPEAAARELERSVGDLGLKGAMLHGRTGARNLDHPDFRPIFEAAARLGVPLYIHPQIPQQAVRDAYYSGFGEDFDVLFASGGVGWHFETGIQFLRLVLSGTFDRHPNLQIILGHWGEVVLFYLDRIDMMSRRGAKIDHDIVHYVRSNLYVTPSGIFSQSYLSRSIEILGAERIMFSTDYPFVFAPGGGARNFLNSAPLSSGDKENVAHGNWERLTQRSAV